MSTPSDRTAGRVRAAERFILALTGLSWILSYTAQVRLAAAHGYTAGVRWPWPDITVTEAHLWPLTVDLLVLVCTVLALELAHRGHGPVKEAWTLAILAAVVMLAANVAGAVETGDWTAVGLHAWPAICMPLGWHVLFRTIGDQAAAMSAPLPAIRPLAVEPEMEVVPAMEHPNGHSRQTTDLPAGSKRHSTGFRAAEERQAGRVPAAAREAYDRLAADGQVTGEALAKTLATTLNRRISDRTGRRYVRDIKAGK